MPQPSNAGPSRRSRLQRPLGWLAVIGSGLAGAALLARLAAAWFGRIASPTRHNPTLGAARPHDAGRANRPDDPAGASGGERAVDVSGSRGVALALTALLVLALLVVAGIEAIVADERPEEFGRPLPEPRQINIDRLQGYEWVDQEAGIVRIPIERAMDLLVERGLPTRPPGEAEQYQIEGRVRPSDASGGRSIIIGAEEYPP